MTIQSRVVRSNLPASTPDVTPNVGPSTAIGGSVIVSESALPTGAATSAKQDTLLAEIQSSPSTATLSSVATSTASATIIASNTARKGITIVNEASDYMYLKFGTTASATSYNVYLPPYATYCQGKGEYDGRMDGILKSGTGTARVAEITD